MEQDIIKRIEQLEAKVDMVYKSAEKTRKYILWTFIFGVVVVVLPLIGLFFAIPTFLDSLNSLEGLL